MAPKKEKDLRENVDGNKLDLSMSELVEVPVKSIAAIRKATCLDLSNNHLVTLPKNFNILTHLIELDLSKNSLRELPDQFGDLVSLKRLDLYGNQLTHLPLSFSQLKALRWLDLKNNPLMPKLAEIAGPCGDAQQCQQCARDVVAALLTAALKVEEERKKKLDEQLKEKERLEQELKKKIEADNAQKKVNKKSKKGKGEKQSSEEAKNTKFAASNGKAQMEWSKVEKQENKRSKQQAVKENKGLFWWLIVSVFWATFTVSLVFMAAVSFALYDRKHFQLKMEQWGTHSNATTDFVLQSAKVVEHAMKHPSVREMRSQLVACFRSIVASMLNIYKTVCQEFPAYYEVIKGKFA